jgi:hypothetical protein
VDAATITAISTGVVAIIGAVGGLIVMVRHVTNPNAHGGGGGAKT